MKIERSAVVVAAAGVVAAIWACESPTRPVRRTAGAAAELAALSRAPRLDRRQPSAHVRRVADVHNRGMIRFFGNLDSYIGPRGKRTSASRCAGLRRLTREVIREAALASGRPVNPILEQSMTDDAVRHARKDCQSALAGALFVPHAAPASGDDIVTPAAVPHLEALYSGYNGMADPFAASLGAVNDAVLSGASAESQGDFDAVYMTTQFAVDDAALWVAFGEELGDGGYCDPELDPENCGDPPDEMALFAPKVAPWVARALLGVITDLAACIGKEISDAHAGNVSEHDMYVRCAGYGAAASAAYGLSWLGKYVEEAIKAGTIGVI